MSEQKQGDSRKRAHSPLYPPFVKDYRPYTGRQLQQALIRSRGGHKDHWDLYYRNNTVNGYKDRHYILREFVELHSRIEAAVTRQLAEKKTGVLKQEEVKQSGEGFSWMEAGCGVGNAMLPIFEEYGHLSEWKRLLGFDISSVAIELLEEKKARLPAALAAKVHVYQLNPCERDVVECPFFIGAPGTANTETACSAVTLASSGNEAKSASAAAERNATSSPSLSFSCRVPQNPVEFVSMVFVLCSIPAELHALVLKRIAACMSRPGSIFFFRDYCVNDHAQARFQNRGSHVVTTDSKDGSSSSHSNTYARTNGTISHFFSVEEVRALFEEVGFTVMDLSIVEREVQNRKEEFTLNRRFLQGRFRL